VFVVYNLRRMFSRTKANPIVAGDAWT